LAINPKTHIYQVNLQWTGNTGEGTANYRNYERSHEISVEGKPSIFGSSDPAFRGDQNKYNPEELLVASLSACHMLWYLHLCAEVKIVAIAYSDCASGSMIETLEGGGRFSEVILKPVVLIQEGCNPELARQLHEKAHKLCFIANSMNFPVRCEPIIQVALGEFDNSPQM
jgi:organic hydroperoxide reductase OsmC/OhrA